VESVAAVGFAAILVIGVRADLGAVGGITVFFAVLSMYRLLKTHARPN